MYYVYYVRWHKEWNMDYCTRPVLHQHDLDLWPWFAGAASKLTVKNHFIGGIAEISALEFCHTVQLRSQLFLLLEVRTRLWRWFGCRSRRMNACCCCAVLVAMTRYDDWCSCRSGLSSSSSSRPSSRGCCGQADFIRCGNTTRATCVRQTAPRRLDTTFAAARPDCQRQATM